MRGGVPPTPAVSTGLSLTIHGARGSMAVAGARYRRFGGNTTCFHVPIAAREHLVIDAGTGLRGVERALGAGPHRFTFLLTHYHWDHIQGLPLFAPLHDPDSDITFIGPPTDEGGVGDVLRGVIRPPWFPVDLASVGATTTYADIETSMRFGPIDVRSVPLHHPQGSTGFRLRGPRRAVVIATDHEHGDPASDAGLARVARGADVLVHDGQYTAPEYEARGGWGHSTPEGAVDAALAARVTRLVLTSHDPDHGDDDVEAMVAAARVRFPLTAAAHEGMTIAL